MSRYCFTLQVRPDLIEEYVERHRAVWPEMLAALAETGWRNYSLFLREDGLLVGYVESDDLAAAQEAMSRTEVNARWQTEMAAYFTWTDGLAAIAGRLEAQAIELPSWAFGNSGTRFKVFGTAGTPRSVEEKIADAATVHRFTGLAPSVALHIPWDKVDDYAALSAYADDHGVRLGTINSNTFQDDDYKFGALTHVDAKVRQKAIDHHFECLDVMSATGSRDLKIWLAEGSNYPGQADLRGRQDRLAEAPATIYERPLTIGDG